MAEAPPAGNGSRLTFNAPLSGERADRLAGEIAATAPSSVVDLGCGWGALLLRAIAVAPGARGIGIDSFGPDIARGRVQADALELADRVTFIEGSAADHRDPADVAISIGAYQAYGDLGDAFRAIGELLSPGGRLIFGAEFWATPPTEERLARMWPGITADACLDLAELVDLAVSSGYRPLRIETATPGEWEEFESGNAADREEWLLANPDHPEAASVRTALDEQRSIWLRGHRGVMGFAYLTLGR